MIHEINGERVEDANQLRLRISMSAPGSTVQVKLLRDGAERALSVKLAEVPNEVARTQPRATSGGSTNALEGVRVEDLNAEYLHELRLPSATKGVVITEVGGGSPAADTGLQSGDVVQEIDHEKINSVADFNRAIRRSPGRTLLLLVNRGGRTSYFAIEPR